MKALLISEDKNFIDNFDRYFSSKGFDTIIYKWLIKALDNIEEIRPNCVILSSSEYPRHWKTLVQFVKSGIGGDKVAFFLYEPNPMSEKDENKAKTLGINGFIKSFEQEDLKVLDEYINECFPSKTIINESEQQEVIKESVREISHDDELSCDEERSTITVDSIISDNNEMVSGTGSFIFTHPLSHKFITGNYFDKNSNKITLNFSKDNELDLSIDMKIDSFSFMYKDEIKTTNATVKEMIKLNDQNFVIFELGN